MRFEDSRVVYDLLLERRVELELDIELSHLMLELFSVNSNPDCEEQQLIADLCRELSTGHALYVAYAGQTSIIRAMVRAGLLEYKKVSIGLCIAEVYATAKGCALLPDLFAIFGLSFKAIHPLPIGPIERYQDALLHLRGLIMRNTRGRLVPPESIDFGIPITRAHAIVERDWLEVHGVDGNGRESYLVWVRREEEWHTSFELNLVRPALEAIEERILVLPGESPTWSVHMQQNCNWRKWDGTVAKQKPRKDRRRL